MDSKDKKTEDLEIENRQLNEKLDQLVKHIDLLSRTHDPLVKVLRGSDASFEELWEGYMLLMRSTSDCIVAVSEHIVKHKDGAEFNVEFVRLAIKQLADDMLTSSDKFTSAGETYRAAIKELLSVENWDEKPILDDSI